MHYLHLSNMPTKPSIADLQAFVTVGELQSFAAAAKALHLSQPALSRRIAHLETNLNVRLFDRTTRSVEFTQLGNRFHVEMRNLLQEMDRSVNGLHDAAHLEAGDITIGCVFSAVHHFLPEVIQNFRAKYPNVMVRIIEEGADEVLASVKTGESDFAINYTGIHDPEIEFVPLLNEPFVLACPANHVLARRRFVRWEELADHSYGLVSHESRNRVLIDQALAKVERRSRPTCEVRHISTLVGLVQNGLVVAVVPQLTLPSDRSTVVGVKLETPQITRTIGRIQRIGRSLSPAAQAFVNMLTTLSRSKFKIA
jgi:DNA-binding transcriptional LysR family regulator